MNASSKAFWLSTALALGACGPGAAPSSDGAANDAAVSETSTASLPACLPAFENQCVQEGCSFAPISLRSCDPGEAEVPFYGADYCDRDASGQPKIKATVIVIAAGWCGPCQMEAPMIEQYIRQGYAAQGVRVLSVVVQAADYTAADANFCNVWRARYGLTSTMVFDPRMSTSRYFPDMALPSNMIVDRHGTIRWRTYGTSAGLREMRAALDEVLASDTGM